MPETATAESTTASEQTSTTAAAQQTTDAKGTTTTDSKDAGGTATSTAATETTATTAATAKAPETYALKVPEGGRVDESDLKRIEQLARANAWSNEDAQAAFDEFDTQMQTQSEAFLTETKADQTYGGAQLEESQKLAKQVIARIRPDGHPRRDSFLRFLNRGGAGNHLEVVAFLADLGKLMAEDRPHGGLSGGIAEKSVEDLLYPTTVKV